MERWPVEALGCPCEARENQFLWKGMGDQCQSSSQGEFSIGCNVSAWCWEFKWFVLIQQTCQCSAVQFVGNDQLRGDFPGKCLHTSAHSWMTAASLRSEEGWLRDEIWEQAVGSDSAQSALRLCLLGGILGSPAFELSKC